MPASLRNTTHPNLSNGLRLAADDRRETTAVLYPGLLATLLIERMACKRHSFSEVANALGVSTGYLQQLRSGFKPTALIDDQTVESFALYLGVTRLEVLLAAGRTDRRTLLLEIGRIKREP